MFISIGSTANCWSHSHAVSITTCFNVTRYDYASGVNFAGSLAFTGKQTVTGICRRFALSLSLSSTCLVTNCFCLGDFNGDGKMDYARLSSNLIYFVSQGNGQFWAPVYQLPSAVNFGGDENTWSTKVSDFNGDCRTDIIRATSRYTRLSFVAWHV